MNDVTKIFVVLVAVLSIALVGMVIPFVASTENYRDTVDEARQAAEAAEARRGLVQSAYSTAQAKVVQLQDEQNQEIVALKKELATSAAEKASLQADLRSQQVLNAANVAELKRLAAAEGQHAEIVKAQSEELAQARASLVRLREENVMEIDAKNEMAGQLEAANRQIRSLLENLARLEAENKDQAERLASLPQDVLDNQNSDNASESMLTVPSVEVTGSVTSVQERDGQTFVQVNVGENDKVTQNTKLVVHRNGEYLGSIAVIAVNPKEAVGRLLLAKGVIRTGDSVVTGPGYN